MGIKVHRALNAFVLSFLAALLALLLDKWQEISDAVTVGDWATAKFLILPVIAGAIGAAIRALQSNISAVPSPEPAENA